jgi:hypothetical protein
MMRKVLMMLLYIWKDKGERGPNGSTIRLSLYCWRESLEKKCHFDISLIQYKLECQIKTKKFCVRTLLVVAGWGKLTSKMTCNWDKMKKSRHNNHGWMDGWNEGRKDEGEKERR